MISSITFKYACLVVTLFLGPVAIAAETPIDAFTAHGQVKGGAPESRITLQYRVYAYFSNDSIHTGESAQANVLLNNGLRVTFTGSSKGQISVEEGTCEITLQQGHIVIDDEPCVDYRLSHKGKPIRSEKILNADDRPYVASVAGDGDVQFYMLAQLDDEEEAAAGLKDSLERAGLTPARIAAIIAAIGIAYEITDDDGSSS